MFKRVFLLILLILVIFIPDMGQTKYQYETSNYAYRIKKQQWSSFEESHLCVKIINTNIYLGDFLFFTIKGTKTFYDDTHSMQELKCYCMDNENQNCIVHLYFIGHKINEVIVEYENIEFKYKIK